MVRLRQETNGEPASNATGTEKPKVRLYSTDSEDHKAEHSYRGFATEFWGLAREHRPPRAEHSTPHHSALRNQAARTQGKSGNLPRVAMTLGPSAAPQARWSGGHNEQLVP